MRYIRVRYRAYPTAAQQRLLAQHAGNVRFVHNLAVEQKLHQVDRRRSAPSGYAQCNGLAELRNDPALVPWLRVTPAQVLQQALHDAEAAFGRWRNGEAGRPRFKRKDAGVRSFRVPQRPTVKRLSRRRGRVTLPGDRSGLLFRWHRTPPGKIKSVTYVGEPDGSWWISVLCETRDRAPAKHRNDQGPVGVDLGVAVPVATSNGEQMTFVALTPGERKRLVRLERRLARQPKLEDPSTGRRFDGKNRARTKQARAKLLARARRRRKDFAEQVSSRLAKNHGLVVFENLNVKGMTASARGTAEQPGRNVRQKAGLNRGVRNVGWGQIVTLTEQKAKRHGAVVVKVDPAFTSQECPDCPTVDGGQRVTRSRYECNACGYAGHADVGAARNVLNRGVAHAVAAGTAVGTASGTGVDACGGPDVLGPAKQEEETGHSTARTAA